MNQSTPIDTSQHKSDGISGLTHNAFQAIYARTIESFAEHLPLMSLDQTEMKVLRGVKEKIHLKCLTAIEEGRPLGSDNLYVCIALSNYGYEHPETRVTAWELRVRIEDLLKEHQRDTLAPLLTDVLPQDIRIGLMRSSDLEHAALRVVWLDKLLASQTSR